MNYTPQDIQKPSLFYLAKEENRHVQFLLLQEYTARTGETDFDMTFVAYVSRFTGGRVLLTDWREVFLNVPDACRHTRLLRKILSHLNAFLAGDDETLTEAFAADMSHTHGSRRYTEEKRKILDKWITDTHYKD